ncbi:hypothetical protein QJS66_19930 [Kocuria rhizophila]|nr:hypothetical protein QJS66_19930 [Kocuria rhizophila]
MTQDTLGQTISTTTSCCWTGGSNWRGPCSSSHPYLRGRLREEPGESRRQGGHRGRAGPGRRRPASLHPHPRRRSARASSRSPSRERPPPPRSRRSSRPSRTSTGTRSGRGREAGGTG